MNIVNDFKKILKTENEITNERKKSSTGKKDSKTKAEKNTAEEKAIMPIARKTDTEKKPQFYKILKHPLITEKTTDLTVLNKYIFVVGKDANKNEVKKAIKSLYGVTVLDVNMVKVPRKKRRRGRILGWRSGFKKAIVTIKEGDKIEITAQ